MIEVCSVIRVCLIIAEGIQTKLTKNSTALRNSWSHKSAGDSPRDDVDDILACLIRCFPLSFFVSSSFFLHFFLCLFPFFPPVLTGAFHFRWVNTPLTTFSVIAENYIFILIIHLFFLRRIL